MLKAWFLLCIIYVCGLTCIPKIIAFHRCHVRNWADCSMLGLIKVWLLVLGRSECDWVKEHSIHI
jgi:hypothetical protein